MLYHARKRANRFLNIHTAYPTWRNVLKEAAFLAAYTFLFLIVFQPFGTFEYQHAYKLLQLAGYGLLIAVGYPFLKKQLLALFVRHREDYSLGQETIFMTSTLLLLTGIAFIYHAYFIEKQLFISHLPVFLSYGVALWSPPAVFFLYRRERLAGQEKNPGGPTPIEGGDIAIKGINQGEHFIFAHEDIYYLKSNGNYVLIYFRKDGALKHEMVRNTLGRISRQLPNGDFMPIHRSFIVNRKNFDRLTRINGKPMLVSGAFGIQLPVTRQYLNSLEKSLKDHRQ